MKIGDSTDVPLPIVSAAAVTIPTLLASTPGNSIGIVNIVTIYNANILPRPIIQIVIKIVLVIIKHPNASNGKVSPAIIKIGLRIPDFDTIMPLKGVAIAATKGKTATNELDLSIVIP